MMILAFISLVGGFVGIPIFEGFHRFGDFLAPVFAPAQKILNAGHAEHHPSVALEVGLMVVSLAIAFAGLFLARWMYLKDPSVPDKAIEEFKGLHTLVYNKYWMDEIYDVLFVNSIVRFSRFLWRAFDDAVIDGIVNGIATLVRGWAAGLRRVQTGLIKDYALSILCGVLLILGYLALR